MKPAREGFGGCFQGSSDKPFITVLPRMKSRRWSRHRAGTGFKPSQD